MSTPVAIKTEEVILENAEYNSAEELDEELQLQLEDSGGESSYIQYQAEPQVSQRQRQQQQNSNMHTSGTATKHSTSSNSGGSGGTSGNGGNTPTTKNVQENEKRIRREIANSNERRRMQSINAGFQNLRSLLPRHEGEKLSKAAILQQTSSYIYELENEKTQLLAQNSQLKRQLGQHETSSNTGGGSGGGGDSANNASANATGGTEQASGVAIKKRKLTDNVINIQTISDSSDEGLGSMSPEPMTLLNAAVGNNTKSQVIITHTAAKELLEMKKQLDKERRLRTMLEEELQAIKRQLYSVATAPAQSSSYIPREVIEHTDNIVREQMEELPPGTVSYVEIDEVTGQQVVVCSSIEELDNEAAAAAAEIITEDNVHEEVILSSTSSTESEQEVNVNAIAKAYAEGNSPSAAVLQPILQAAIKATPKVEVERIIKVKTEKIEQPSGLTRSRQNLETIVEAIRHLEGDHLFGEGSEQKLHQQQQKTQEAPLALTTKTVHAQRATLAELRPYLQIKGNKQVTIVGGSGLTLTPQQLAAATKVQQSQSKDGGSNATTTPTVTPTAIYKVQTNTAPTNSGGATTAQQVTITTTSLKQCRPGVIVAKQLS